MFKIVQRQKVWWPVKVRGVTDEGGEVEHVFKMRFVLLDEEENADLQYEIDHKLAAEIEDGQDGDDQDGADNTGDSAAQKITGMKAKLVMRIAEDWQGIEMEVPANDESGDGGSATKSLPFTHENILIVMKQPQVFWAVLKAYGECRNGAPKARSGN